MSYIIILIIICKQTFEKPSLKTKHYSTVDLAKNLCHEIVTRIKSTFYTYYTKLEREFLRKHNCFSNTYAMTTIKIKKILRRSRS